MNQDTVVIETPKIADQSFSSNEIRKGALSSEGNLIFYLILSLSQAARLSYNLGYSVLLHVKDGKVIHMKVNGNKIKVLVHS